MVTTSVERLEGSTVKLTVTVPVEGVEASIAEAYNTIGAKIKVPGFRKGKVPRPVVDNYVGKTSVLAEATENVVNDWYPRAIDAESLRPIESPEIDELDTVEPGQEYTFSCQVSLRPELEVERYEGMVVQVPRREVIDADIDTQLAEIRERFASLVPVEDRPIAADDFALISFVSHVDGEAYDGNTVDKYLYELGRGLMPPEFDAGLLGMEAGGETHIEFTIPETTDRPDYAGKTAQFEVTVHEIKSKKLPEVDDDFAAEMGFESAEALREDVRSRLDMQRTLNYTRAKEKRAREALAERAPGEIPEPMIQSRAQSLDTDFRARLEEQGMTLEQYANMTGLTPDAFQAHLRADAEQLIREDLALEALFRQLGLEVTDEEIDKELEDIASATEGTVEEARTKWSEVGLMPVLKEGVMHRRAVEWLMENVEAVEVEDQPSGSADSQANESEDGSAEPAEGTKKTTRKRAPKNKETS